MSKTVKESVYHIGFIKPIPSGIYANGHKEGTLICQCRRNIDYLSTGLWIFEGAHVTTLKALKAKKAQILAAVNKTYNTNFVRLVFE